MLLAAADIICRSGYAPIAFAASEFQSGKHSVTAVREVSQFGVTWFFEKPALVGKFVNGDSYVIGPVTVIDINPAPLFGEIIPASEIGPREKLRIPSAQLGSERFYGEPSGEAGRCIR